MSPTERSPRRSSRSGAVASTPVIVLDHSEPWAGPPQPDAARAHARIHALFGAPLLLVLAGIALGVALNVVLGVVVALLGAVWAGANHLIGAPARVLGQLPGELLDPTRDASVILLTEGLCLGNGITLPEMRVIEDDAPNAVLLGRSRSEPVLLVTKGLLRRLDRIELEGVLAHELAHLKRGEWAYQLEAIEALGALSLITGASPRLLRVLLGFGHESLADQTAVAMTRYPPGLSSALERISRVGTVSPKLAGRTVRLTAPLWCAPLPAARGAARPGELDLDQRIALLSEL
jgi:heat shock protein HtpX